MRPVRFFVCKLELIDLLLSRGLLCIELGRLATTTRADDARAAYRPNLPKTRVLIQRTPQTAPQEILRGFGEVRRNHKNRQRPDLQRICADCGHI